MAETGNTTRTQLINLEGLSTFLDESKKIFEPTLPSGVDDQVLKLSGGKPKWGTDNTPTKFTWTNGTTAGPTGSLSGDGMSAVSFAAIPSASASASGVVTTDTQTFAGTKTFNNTITGSITGNAGTATKLKTARSLKITDDGTNTSTGVDFDGSDAVTLKLPSTIKASLTGNADTATKATGDKSGNEITTTYATKAELTTALGDVETLLSKI